ncbi:MAG TPA: hypothetical protein VK884_00070, partial [Verrucomicrobiae bacterium]|nr:hypothetical protein [Verrucomicrobiae bacterium]
FDRAKKIECELDRCAQFTSRSENLRSRAMAPNAGARDLAIGAKFRARGARSLAREISFAIRANSDKFFCALVLIAK